MEKSIHFILNNRKYIIKTDSRRRLLDVLREDFNLKGMKDEWEEGKCGAYSVIIDGELINASLVSIGSIEGKWVMTIEGYRKTRRFEILKEAFEKAHSVEFGFSTNGMIMAIEVFLSNNPKPNEKKIKDFIKENIDNCTGYNRIVEGIKMAAQAANEG